ncbi:uncharacterized protein KY384_000423 [Bacidia gigantensis]|uniref:uncharacterized protein n=1 Tax=Bacidia gigantensis TaxID=2732470 RepID=UPI001D057322|nr:uncharacterized protein KY384_000423 [Bacidia gigantensis]KAG8525663.1 hypothetical protein KY384_000423 [Bacidia gigantensis]
MNHDLTERHSPNPKAKNNDKPELPISNGEVRYQIEPRTRKLYRLLVDTTARPQRIPYLPDRRTLKDLGEDAGTIEGDICPEDEVESDESAADWLENPQVQEQDGDLDGAHDGPVDYFVDICETEVGGVAVACDIPAVFTVAVMVESDDDADEAEESEVAG